MASDTASMMGTYGQRLLDNDYVQENLSQAVESLRAAYRRATKRRVEPTRDQKLRRQVREAAHSFAEAASALKADRQKPERRRGRRLIVVLALGAGGTAALLATNEELRRKILGDNSGVGGDVPDSANSQVPVTA
jgi:chemotaxis response regulator CheB